MTQKTKANRNTATNKSVTLEPQEMKSVLMEQKDFLLPVVQEAVQAMLEVEMDECFAGRQVNGAPSGWVTAAGITGGG